jgi:asparagine synthase (glutamine-hydrolysing)
MCGIAGLLDLARSTNPDELAATAARMAAAVRHRGPDDRGVWVDAEHGVALGHQRLAIIDLSEAGAQPMHSASARYVITYNGEIYNAEELASELRASGRRFGGHSDTEVLREAIDAWGLERAIERANGMFAFALWDRTRRHLTLARDRLGEKPLYYAWLGTTFVFGSELSALRAHPRFAGEIDRGALALYLRYACVPAPFSIYEGVSKLPPATTLHVDPSNGRSSAEPRSYWSAIDAYEHRASPRAVDDVIDELDDLLRDAVKVRMRSDVPLGAFFSGGIDSSTIVALMQAQSADPVSTFTIGNTARTFNEADRANAVAQHLRTRHHELLVTPDDALEVIPKLPQIYDEPFGDPSQIPTLLVAEIAKRDVKVSLSGDGGDEVFGGYNRYRWVPWVTERFGRLPAAARRLASNAMVRVRPKTWDRLAAVVPSGLRPTLASTKMAKLAAITRLEDVEPMYRELVTQWDDPAAIVVDGCEPVVPAPPVGRFADGVGWMMATDTVTYLPDDTLVKVDRATMSVSLEARVPFLDHRVV